MRSLQLFLFVIALFSCSSNNEAITYKDPTQPIDKRVDDLISRMTLEEKIYQLNQWTVGINTNANNISDQMKKVDPKIGSLINFSDDPAFRNEVQKKAIEESRLGIPILMGFDVIHGFRTVYPIALGQACSWNPELVKKASQVAAKESRMSGVDWTFSPMIDVARDARWGRISEGYGEDPYANAVFGVATVEGYQGSDLNNDYTVAACLKHYVGYGESEGGRDYHYTEVSDQTLWDTYLPPYEACIKAGAATVMSAFNDISGVPATSNYYTLTEILKEKWGHEGFVLSDWNAVQQLINQGAAKDRKQAAELAFNAGVEMCMVDNCYFDYLAELVDEGKVSMDLIDSSVARILRLKFQLGLFEKPYTDVISPEKRYLQPESKKIAEQLAEESIVLLKNQEKILPLKGKNIALIGPMAEEQETLLGAWSYHGKLEHVVSIADGLKDELAGKATITIAKGCDFDGDDISGFAKAKSVARAADVVVLCLGEKRYWSGEDGNRHEIEYPAIQEELVKEVAKTGKPIVLLLSSGRTMALKNVEPLADAMVMVWQPGIMAGKAIAGVLSGRVNPSGKLPVTFPYATGQIPLYYNMRQAARLDQGVYEHLTKKPLYWFGHGLSYTSFKYGDVKLSAEKITKTEKLLAEVIVENTGDVEGQESVLWFISDPYATITRPMKELKFFEKKTIVPGEKVKYTFEIDPMEDLSYPNRKGERILESGEFFVLVGNQKVKFELID